MVVNVNAFQHDLSFSLGTCPRHRYRVQLNLVPRAFPSQSQGKSPGNEVGYSYLATLQVSFAPEQNSCMSLLSSPYRDEIDSLEVFARSQCTGYRPSKFFQFPGHISRTSKRPQLFPASAADK